MQNPDILNLPGWQVIGCEDREDRYVIQARPCSPRVPCPDCGSRRGYGHGRDFQTLHDLPCHGKQVTIHIDLFEVPGSGDLSLVPDAGDKTAGVVS